MIMRSLFTGLIMALVGLAAAGLRPTPRGAVDAPDIDAVLPAQFGEWRPVEIADAVLPFEANAGGNEAVAYRAWRDAAGRVVTLVAAYGPPLGDSVRLHRPESCYNAQGFSVSPRGAEEAVLGGRKVQLIHLDTEKGLRKEAVTYWLRDGDSFASAAGAYGFRFNAARDGALIRVSSPGVGEEGAFELQTSFLEAFTEALSPPGRLLFLGAAG